MIPFLVARKSKYIQVQIRPPIRRPKMKFTELFKTATGNDPFPYQRAFATGPVLPDLLEAPTGAGKTATAVLGWLWRRRFAAEKVRAATPRRLVFCLPMRSLVNQTIAATRDWLEQLGLQEQVSVFSLLGGAVNNTFDAQPEADAILVGTQDQLLSRALNRGYAMSRFRWPMHYALLNNDCLWVMDEVQLMGVGLSTSAQLAALRESWKSCGPSASLWMSATMDPRLLKTVDAPEERTRLTLSAADREHEHLKGRLEAPKQLSLDRELYDSDSATYIAALAKAVAKTHEAGTRTLVVLNQVARAQALYAELRDQGAALLHSRYRPADRRTIEERVLAPDWQGILIATQAIEAGVDISSKHMFTELSQWSSLVQRFGRTNRRGEWSAGDAATITVIDLGLVESDNEAKAQKAYVKRALPYEVEDLDHARELVLAHASAAPADLDVGHPERAEPASPVLRRRDAYELFDTTPDLNGRDLDVSRWVRDKGGPDLQLAWRTWEEDVPPADAPALHADELCTVPFAHASDFIKKATKRDKASCWSWDSLEGRWMAQLAPPIPGQSYLLTTKAGGYEETTGWTGNTRHVPQPVEPEKTVPQDDDEADRLTYASQRFVLLAQHAEETHAECVALRGALAGGEYGELPWDLIERAARWHDLGKAHPCFQEMLVSALAEDDKRRNDGPWAKSDNPRGGKRCTRPHFRHELASALAMVAQGEHDLASYLVACHHGKVRLAIRSRPTETGPSGNVPFALGVHEGDKLPETSLGAGFVVPEVTLLLDVMKLGECDGRLSWAARASALVEIWGPFRLALMETLVRISDWRASRLHTTRSEDLTHA